MKGGESEGGREKKIGEREEGKRVRFESTCVE
jgi:hypothetical protein